MRTESSIVHSEVDTLFIGTSPLVLLRALAACKSGQRIAILDRRSERGGAWNVHTTMGYSNVEAAVHLIENRPRVYAHLERLGIRLEAADAACWGQWRGLRMPLQWSRVLSFAGVCAKSIALGKLDKARTNARSTARAMRCVRSPFRYPTTGASQLINLLLDALAAHGVQPQCGVSIDHAEFMADRSSGIATTTHGTIRFKRLALASRAHCPISIGGIPMPIVCVPSVTECIAIRVIHCGSHRFSYVELLADPLLRRMRDLSSMVSPTPPHGERVLSMQVRPSSRLQDLSAIAYGTLCVERLIDRGLLPDGAIAVDACRTNYAFDTIPNGALSSLARELQGALIPIHTTDFAEELLSLLDAAH